MEKEKLLDMALEGDSNSLGILLTEVQKLVFNLSLRMLGNVQDAEDATQEILIKIMTNLSSFRKESRYETWVYRVAVNYLINYKKSFFKTSNLNFEVFANDLNYSYFDDFGSVYSEMEQESMADELKLSCTNVMLQCFDPDNRCIFILGTMFKIPSGIASDILGISPDVYRKRLSRARKKMADFLSQFCSHSGYGPCYCRNRVSYAIKNKRLDPDNLEYSKLKKLDRSILLLYKHEMEQIDNLSIIFDNSEVYNTPSSTKNFVESLLHSTYINKLKNFSPAKKCQQ